MLDFNPMEDDSDESDDEAEEQKVGEGDVAAGAAKGRGSDGVERFKDSAAMLKESSRCGCVPLGTCVGWYVIVGSVSVVVA